MQARGVYVSGESLCRGQQAGSPARQSRAALTVAAPPAPVEQPGCAWAPVRGVCQRAALLAQVPGKGALRPYPWQALGQRHPAAQPRPKQRCAQRPASRRAAARRPGACGARRTRHGPARSTQARTASPPQPCSCRPAAPQRGSNTGCRSSVAFPAAQEGAGRPLGRKPRRPTCARAVSAQACPGQCAARSSAAAMRSRPCALAACMRARMASAARSSHSGCGAALASSSPCTAMATWSGDMASKRASPANAFT
jgi:hypothetical protein